MQLPPWFYPSLSLAAPFAITFLLLQKPKSFLFLVALAAVLFVLFGPLALPGFFVAVGLRALLPGKQDSKKKKREVKTKKARGPRL